MCSSLQIPPIFGITTTDFCFVEANANSFTWFNWHTLLELNQFTVVDLINLVSIHRIVNIVLVNDHSGSLYTLPGTTLWTENEIRYDEGGWTQVLGGEFRAAERWKKKKREKTINERQRSGEGLGALLSTDRRGDFR